MAELTMPRLSDTMEEGTIGRWVKKPGEHVEKGEILVEIETDKATMELEAYETGTLQQILVNEGQTVPIGAPIAVIGEGAAAAGHAAAPEPTANRPATAPEGEPAATERQADKPVSERPTPDQEVATNGHAPNDDHIKASPVARRLAQEYGIDLHLVQGTGPGGRIIKENVEEYHSQQGASKAPAAVPAAAPKPAPRPAPAPQAKPTITTPAPAPKPAAPAPASPAAPPAGTIVPMTRMRRAIARSMSQSKHGIPHIYVTVEVDMGAAMALRQQINESGMAPSKISVNDLVVKAVAKALAKYPSLNSSYAVDAEEKAGTIFHAQINLAVAIALEEGLVAPVVFDADKKSLGTISAEIKDLVGRGREGKLRQEELERGTFTVSNMGMYEVVEFDMIITPPQAASLAVGAVRKVPVVRNDQIVIGEMMFITVSVDHRVADGATGAQFVRDIKHLLETPMGLLV